MATQQVNPEGGGELPEGPAAAQRTAPMLRRSRGDRVIAGICGGIGRYLGVDPVLIRIAWVALAFAWGAGVLLYLIGWIVIPEEREGEVIVAAEHADGATARLVIGGVLMVVGAILLVNRFAPWVDARLVGALVLIALGLLVITRGVSR